MTLSRTLVLLCSAVVLPVAAVEVEIAGRSADGSIFRLRERFDDLSPADPRAVPELAGVANSASRMDVEVAGPAAPGPRGSASEAGEQCAVFRNPSGGHISCGPGPVTVLDGVVFLREGINDEGNELFRCFRRCGPRVPARLDGVSLTTDDLVGDDAGPGDAVDEPVATPILRGASNGSGFDVHVVVPIPDFAQIRVYRGGELEARSAEFDFALAANHGASWVEDLAVISPSAFRLSLRLRQTCGPWSADYRFTRHDGEWLLAEVEQVEPACDADGSIRVPPARHRVFVREGRILQRHALADFIAFSDEYVRAR